MISFRHFALRRGTRLLLSDIDAYADEMLFSIARRLGFGNELEKIVDAGVH